MKFLTLVCLIPHILAYGNKLRKALPKTVPLKHDVESLDFQSYWDEYVAEKSQDFHNSGPVKADFKNGVFDETFMMENVPKDNAGKTRNSEPKTFLDQEDVVGPAVPPSMQTAEGSLQLIKSKNFHDQMRNRLSNDALLSIDADDYSEEFADIPTLKVTVPLSSYGFRYGAFPKQEITYQMGTRVLTDDVAIYIIYYGGWSQQQKDILNEFTASLGDSSWWNIMRKYYSQKDINSEKVYVKGKLRLIKSVDDPYSLGRDLNNDALPRLINSKVQNGMLPKDSSGIYIVLTSDDVQEEFKMGKARMCRDYCGYHLTGKFTDGSIFYYALAGRPTKCLLSCGGPNGRSSPNGDPATDAMVSAIAHELAEAVSDPEVKGVKTRAWNDAKYMENGDMCAYKYGQLQRVSTGGRNSFYNYVSAAGTKFLVQQNWDPELQKCVSSA